MLRSRLLLAIGLLLVAPPLMHQAGARTAPRRGAAHKPRQFKIQAPFPCGTPIRINCSYGTRCSPAHKRVHAPVATNDYYAVDFIRAEEDNGHGKPVVAVAPGVVRMAGWSKRGFAPYGKIVYIEHDFEDRGGKRYQTLYAHLSRVLVKRGQRVEAGTVIGLLGGSSKRRRRVFGSHLHFAMYRGAKPYLGGGQAVVPEPMGAQEDLRPRMRWTACSGPAPMPVASLEGPVDATATGGLIDSADQLPGEAARCAQER